MDYKNSQGKSKLTILFKFQDVCSSNCSSSFTHSAEQCYLPHRVLNQTYPNELLELTGSCRQETSAKAEIALSE